MTSMRWGLLSTAAIGRLVVEATRGSDSAEFVAVASRDGAKAEAFARANGLPLAFGSYEEMLASDALDAVYVALPISMHAEWTVKALEAGKHVLCEKPFVTTAEDADRCFAAAESAGRLCAGEPLPFGRADAVAQAATLEALDASARSGSPLVPLHPSVPNAPGT